MHQPENSSTFALSKQKLTKHYKIMLYEKVSYRKQLVANYSAQFFTKGRNGGEIVHTIFGETIEDILQKRSKIKRNVSLKLYDVRGNEPIFIRII